MGKSDDGDDKVVFEEVDDTVNEVGEEMVDDCNETQGVNKEKISENKRESNVWNILS